ncbi:MAG: serine/threonine-protein kinase, partial [Verrucomicrobiota bacterium]
MEFSTHLTKNLEPPELSTQGQTNKRTFSGASEFTEELQSLKLRNVNDTRFSLSSSNFTSSGTDLTSISSGGEIDHLLDPYLHPSSETTSSPVLLQSSSPSCSSTAGTENTEVVEDSDTDTEPEGEQDISLDHSSPTTEESVEENLPDWAFQEPEDMTHFDGIDTLLASKGIERAPHFFGKGAFGRVYDATIKGDPKSYLYKHYLNPVSFTKEEGKFWRQSDFAAARLHDIPHLVKPLFFIVLVKGADGSQKKIFLPESKVQQFGKSLPPGSNVVLQGQFMEKVPGRPLQALREEGLTLFTPDRPHFRNIAIALRRFLTASRPHNFMHRDLSLNNIIYDKNTKKVSIIDIGQGVRLRSRGKVEEM